MSSINNSLGQHKGYFQVVMIISVDQLVATRAQNTTSKIVLGRNLTHCRRSHIDRRIVNCIWRGVSCISNISMPFYTFIRCTNSVWIAENDTAHMVSRDKLARWRHEDFDPITLNLASHAKLCTKYRVLGLIWEQISCSL